MLRFRICWIIKVKLNYRFLIYLISYRFSLNFPYLEYEKALKEFNQNSNEAILRRIVSNPIHVYKLVRDTEYFASLVVPKLEDDLDLDSK